MVSVFESFAVWILSAEGSHSIISSTIAVDFESKEQKDTAFSCVPVVSFSSESFPEK